MQHYRKKDTLVLYPTGSGKSLCFQFPPIYENKKGIIITPTISLMQDQLDKLNEMGISSIYLGSAQFDKSIEKCVFEPNSQESLIFVTPECRITKPANRIKNLIQLLASRNQLSLKALCPYIRAAIFYLTHPFQTYNCHS